MSNHAGQGLCGSKDYKLPNLCCLGKLSMKVFISYTSSGAKHAEKIQEDLKEQNIGLWIDKGCLVPGQLWLKEIDKSLYQVDYVLAIITEDYVDSIGGVEAYAKMSEGFNKKDMRFLPLFFMDPKKVPSVIIPAIQGFTFHESYDKGLHDLIRFLKEEQQEDAGELLTRVESTESKNPFRRVRAEYFHDDYHLLGMAFAEPEKEKYEMLQESKPVIIYGGRGSGKTMILKSLIPDVLSTRLDVKTFREAKKKGVNFLSVYFKLKKGSLLMYDYHPILEMGFLKTGLSANYELYKNLMDKLKRKEVEDEPVLTAGLNAAWTISLNELNLKILKTTIQTLQRLQKKSFVEISRKTEEDVIGLIVTNLTEQNANVRTFDDLEKYVNKELHKIELYLQNLAIPFASPVADWCQTGLEFLDGIFEILANNISDFKDIHFFMLFDEFENLRPFQQIIINEWIKTASNFTVKLSAKFEGMYTNRTHQGQPLQAGQDYFTFTLDYDLFDDTKYELYQNLLIQISEKLLTIENYAIKDIRKLLEESKERELPQEIVDNEIKNIRIAAGLEFSEKELSEYRNKLETAAIFRLLRKRQKIEGRKGKKKMYDGFVTYTYLSSGIIRIFLNLVGMALYKAENDGINVKEGKSIPTQHQTWAAYVVSKAWLEKIPINLEEYGETMYQFIVDIGEIFRERLLYHPTEPETLTVSVKDPYALEHTGLLKMLLCYSVQESLLYPRMKTSSMKPKQSFCDAAKEYCLNRIYTPILEISYRPRWPRGGEFATSELSDLLNPEKRAKIKKLLRRRQHGKTKALGTKRLGYFNGEVDRDAEDD